MKNSDYCITKFNTRTSNVRSEDAYIIVNSKLPELYYHHELGLYYSSSEFDGVCIDENTFNEHRPIRFIPLPNSLIQIFNGIYEGYAFDCKLYKNAKLVFNINIGGNSGRIMYDIMLDILGRDNVSAYQCNWFGISNILDDDNLFDKFLYCLELLKLSDYVETQSILGIYRTRIHVNHLYIDKLIQLLENREY